MITKADLLAEYDEEYLECRDFHVWEMQGGFWHEGIYKKRRRVCGRCGAEAVDRWTLAGGRKPSLYRRPGDYRLPGVTKRDVRREILARAPRIYETEEEMLRDLLNERKS